MPEVKLRDDSFDPEWIHAVMLFPEHEDRREAIYAFHCAEQVLRGADPTGTVELESRVLSAIVHTSGRATLLQDAYEGARHGYVAGDVLLNLFAMHSFPQHFDEPSTRKALYATKEYSYRTNDRERTVRPRSVTAIRQHFDEARSVAHFWAALRLHKSYPKRAHEDILSTPDGIRDLLGIAATIQDFGCSFVPYRPKGGTSVLNMQSIWRVPESTVRLQPTWQEPPRWLIEVMKAYRA